MEQVAPNEDAKWLADRAFDVFCHYSNLRIQISTLNVTAMGVLFFYLEGGISAEEIGPINFALVCSAIFFSSIVFKISSAASFHWGIYRKFRNLILKSDSVFEKEMAEVEDSYGVLMLSRKSVIRGSVRKPYWLGGLWRPIVVVPNFLFWPAINLVAPLLLCVYVNIRGC